MSCAADQGENALPLNEGHPSIPTGPSAVVAGAGHNGDGANEVQEVDSDSSEINDLLA